LRHHHREGEIRAPRRARPPALLPARPAHTSAPSVPIARLTANRSQLTPGPHSRHAGSRRPGIEKDALKLLSPVDALFNAAMDASISRALTGEILRTLKGLTVTSRLTDQRHSVAGPAPYR